MEEDGFCFLLACFHSVWQVYPFYCCDIPPPVLEATSLGFQRTQKTNSSLGIPWSQAGTPETFNLVDNNYEILDLSVKRQLLLTYWGPQSVNHSNKSPSVLFLYKTLTNTVLHFRVHYQGKPRKESGGRN